MVLSAFPAIQVLRKLPDVEYRDRHEHFTFHPLGIYNISRAKCTRAFKRVMDELDKRKSITTFNDRVEELLDAYEALLHSLANHRDDCLTIFTLANTSTQKPAQPSKPLIQVIDHHFEQPVMVPINNVKHHTHRLAPVVYADLEYVVPGFFFVGAVAKGVAGPSPVVHRRGGEEHSFHLALRHLFLGVHEISTALAKAVEALLPAEASAIGAGSLDGDVPKLEFIGNWFSQAPRFRFPGEYGISVPDIKIESSRFVFNRHSQKRVVDCRNRSMEVTVTHTGDGATNSIRIPKPHAR